MKKILFIIILCFISIFEILAQKGSVAINMSCLNESKKIALVALYKDDEFINKGVLFAGEEDTYFDRLLPGKYKLKTYLDDSIYVIHTIEIIADKQLHLFLCDELPYYTESIEFPEEKMTTWKDYGSLRAYFEPNFLPTIESKKIKSIFKMGYDYNYSKIFNKRFAGIAGLGTHLGIANFSKNYSNLNIKKERYINWDLTTELLFRYSFYNNQIIYSQGFFIDLGLGYSFPIVFRYTQHLNNDTKLVKDGIHYFNDVYATTRFGYSTYFIKADYRFVNFINQNYQQMPKLTLSVGLIAQFQQL
jgi:hypothetical protein